MAQDFGAFEPGSETPPGSNAHEYTVGEIAFAVKQTIEDSFGRVRVRGEVSRPKRAASGHLYMTLKDDKAVLDAVAWRGVAGRLSIQPEEGMEVVVTGRMTTYPGNSRYQLIIESVELAGEGALLKLLEERRKRLAAEGLFDEERKQALPFLPSVIGVVTSPTGAVIRDILHRLEDRFPRHVLLWPVIVQGETAAAKIAAAIEGFAGLPESGAIPRPDVLIVGRGGGSLEDLMAFNEEAVVRAVVACPIPVISAVGHETDTTLIDFAADRRAPTPTAAAEMAVPVRADLIADAMDKERRLFGAATRALSVRETNVEGLARGLGDPIRLIDYATQKLDDRVTRWQRAQNERLTRLGDRLVGLRIRHPKERLESQAVTLATASDRLASATKSALSAAEKDFGNKAERLALPIIERRLTEAERTLGKMALPSPRRLAEAEARVEALGQMLTSLSYERVLDRGFAVVRDGKGSPVADAAKIKPGDGLSVQLRDGSVAVVAGGSAAKKGPKKAPAADQGDLF